MKKHGFSSTLAILEFSELTHEQGGIITIGTKMLIRYDIVLTIGVLLSGTPCENMYLQNPKAEFPLPKAFVALMEGVTCQSNEGRSWTFHVDELKHLNIGSVQR